MAGKADFQLGIDGDFEPVATLSALKHALKGASSASEILLSHHDGMSLSMLASGDRAWLMFLREEGDSGFSSRGEDAVARKRGVREFRLSNGQIDEYPIAWTLPRERAVEALEYFFEHRERPPFVKWHED